MKCCVLLHHTRLVHINDDNINVNGRAMATIRATSSKWDVTATSFTSCTKYLSITCCCSVGSLCCAVNTEYAHVFYSCKDIFICCSLATVKLHSQLHNAHSILRLHVVWTRTQSFLWKSKVLSTCLTSSRSLTCADSPLLNSLTNSNIQLILSIRFVSTANVFVFDGIMPLACSIPSNNFCYSHQQSLQTIHRIKRLPNLLIPK